MDRQTYRRKEETFVHEGEKTEIVAEKKSLGQVDGQTSPVSRAIYHAELRDDEMEGLWSPASPPSPCRPIGPSP